MATASRPKTDYEIVTDELTRKRLIWTRDERKGTESGRAWYLVKVPSMNWEYVFKPDGTQHSATGPAMVPERAPSKPAHAADSGGLLF